LVAQPHLETAITLVASILWGRIVTRSALG